MKISTPAIAGSAGLLLAALTTLGIAAPAPPEKPTLAFVSSKVRGGAIYVVTPGGEAKRLSYNDNAAKDYGSGAEPAWSPDGRKIAFTRPDLQPMKGDIYVTSAIAVMDANGTNVKQLTKGTGDLQPAWSPDGKRIAFSSSRDGKLAICVMDADGTNVKPLTKEQLCSHPVWSPDGKKIAFLNYPGGALGPEVRVMDADGSNVVTLAATGPSDVAVAWSPDGKKLAFIDGTDVRVINPDGSNLKTLRARGGKWYAERLAWSPDGGKIAYTEPVGDAGEVFVMDADGSHATQLTKLGGRNVRATWSPDGKALAFLHTVTGKDCTLRDFLTLERRKPPRK